MSPRAAQSSSNSEVEIRQAEEQDFDTLLRLINAAFVVELPFLVGERMNVARLTESMQTGTYFLASIAGEPVGCMRAAVRQERGYVGLLAVRPDRQGNGLGRKLVAAGEEFFRTQGCTVAELGIVDGRTELIPIYEKLGYRRTGTAPMPAGIETRVPCHLILFAKALD